jgi:hypothetical protein
VSGSGESDEPPWVILPGRGVARPASGDTRQAEAAGTENLDETRPR